MYDGIKSFLRYTGFFLVFAAVIVVVFFHYEIAAATNGAVPDSFVLVVALVIFLAIAWALYRHEKDLNLLKYQFLTIASHKFRTPLTGIKWATTPLHKDDLPHEEREDILKEIEASTGRLLEVVDMLIGLAKFDNRLSYSFEAVSLREMLDATLEKYGPKIREKAIKFSIKTDPQIPLIIIDKKKIQFVIDMIVENALKYTPASGTISIHLVKSGKQALLSITDTGIGITRSELRHVFRKFYRTESARKVDTEGMGLGLFAARSIIEAHSGRLTADSAGINKGSTFTIALPIKTY